MRQMMSYRCALRCGMIPLLLVLLLVCNALPVASASAPQLSSDEVGPYLGAYHPNTMVELRGETLVFSRPPYESALIPEGEELFLFEAGWLAGRSMRFSANESGGKSILLRGDDGGWSEFARSGLAYPNVDLALAAKFEQLLDQAVAARESPGVALAVSLPGQGFWAGARGLSNRPAGIPAVPDDRFRLASVTKPFVATVVLQLMQEGKLSLDDSLEHWLPGLVPGGEAITLRQLLNHTSGLYDYLNEPFMDVVLAEPARVWSPEELVGRATARDPYFAPGEPGRWRYSNTNYVLLAMVVERASGLSLDQAIRQRISVPLGLSNTFVAPAETLPGGIARGYIGRRDVTDIDMSYAWGAGNMVSTVEDLTRFAQALFDGKLLGAEAMAQMQTFVDTAGVWGGHDIAYGLGLIQDRKRPGDDSDPGELARGHSGTLAGYRIALWYLPERGVIISVAMNEMDAKTDKVSDGVITILRERGWS